MLFSAALLFCSCRKESQESAILSNTARMAGNHTWTGTVWRDAGSISLSDTTYVWTFERAIIVLSNKKIVFPYSDTLTYSSYDMPKSTITYTSHYQAVSPYEHQEDTLFIRVSTLCSGGTRAYITFILPSTWCN
jgi:hypothetical protein